MIAPSRTLRTTTGPTTWPPLGGPEAPSRGPPFVVCLRASDAGDGRRRRAVEAVPDTTIGPGRPPWPPGIHRERWSINGEVCITGLDPPFDGGAGLAHALTWLLREYASRCRRTYRGTGVLAFTCTGPRTPTQLAQALSLWFDLPLEDSRLIREDVRRRGGEPGAFRWPSLWLEGAAREYLLIGAPPSQCHAARSRLLVLAEERQVFVSSRGVALPDRIRRRWTDGLHRLAGIDDAAVRGLLRQAEHGFLANMLVLVHAQSGARVQPRPTPEESLRRHDSLVDALAPLAAERGLPVEWHALWRLPGGMACSRPDGQPWMRYPAVSFVVGVRSFPSNPAGGRGRRRPTPQTP